MLMLMKNDASLGGLLAACKLMQLLILDRWSTTSVLVLLVLLFLQCYTR